MPCQLLRTSGKKKKKNDKLMCILGENDPNQNNAGADSKSKTIFNVKQIFTACPLTMS